MIVVCTHCAAKFKVADEKVGAKGAKLRCSKCQTVFLVRRDEPVGEPSRPPAPARPPPLPKRGAAATLAPPVAAPRPSPAAPELDLEVSVGHGLGPGPDPFALPPARPVPAATHSPELGPATVLPDLGPLLTDDPFAAGFSSAALEGPAAPRADDPFAGPRLTGPDPFAAVQAPVPEDLDHPPVAGPSGAVADDPFAAPGGMADLALEERAAPPVRPTSSAPFDDHVEGAASDPFDSANLYVGRPDDVPPLVTDPYPTAVAPDPGPAEPEPLPRASSPVRPAAAPAPATAGPATSGAAEDDQAEAARPSGRLRAALVNALSLALVLLAAVALVVVWHGGVPLSQALHPATILAAMRHRPQAEHALLAEQVSSGLYERERGAPLLFVRGVVTSQAAAAVGRVRVTVELLRAGEVVAHGEAVAGALLGPEELYDAGDAADLARRVAAARSRAPAALAPGATEPFLVVLTDYPPDLVGAAVRVSAAPLDGP